MGAEAQVKIHPNAWQALAITHNGAAIGRQDRVLVVKTHLAFRVQADAHLKNVATVIYLSAITVPDTGMGMLGAKIVANFMGNDVDIVGIIRERCKSSGKF